MLRILDWLMIPLLLLAVWFIIFRKMSKGVGGGGAGGGMISVGKPQAKSYEKENNVKVIF